MDDDIDVPDVYGADDEDNFRRNMQKLREQNGWSQGELARRMQEAGWSSFHQTTVSRIEKGERPVRLGEARGIAKVLGTITSQMILPDDEFASIRELELTLDKLRMKRDALVQAFLDVSTWRDIAKRDLEEVLEQKPSSGMDGPVADRRQFFIDRAEKWTREHPLQAVHEYLEENYGSLDYELPEIDDGVDSEEEAAEALRTPVSTLRYWRHMNKGPRAARIGGRIMYRQSDLESWLEAQFDQA